MKEKLFRNTVKTLSGGIFFISSTLGPISEKYQKNPQKPYPNLPNPHTQNIGSVDEFKASQMGDVFIPGTETKEFQSEKEFLPEIPSISLQEEESKIISEMVTRKAPDTLMAVSLDPEKIEKFQNITNPDLSKRLNAALFLQEEAKNWDGELAIKLLTQTNENSEIEEVSVVLEAQNDFTWNEVDYKRNGIIFHGSEGDIHWINQSEEGSKIVIAKLDDTLKEDLLKALTRCGYINENTSFEFPPDGSLIPVEIDKDGNISQIITKDLAYFLTLKTFSQGADVNLRKEPNTSSQVLGQINEEVIIPTPEAVPDNLNLFGAIANGSQMVEVSNEGYTWILVETPTPEGPKYAWVAYSLPQVQNIPLKEVAVGPNTNEFKYFKEKSEIFYYDSEINPHEEYKITEEEYRQTKETVNEYTPQEVINEAEGKYSHELRGYVKQMDGKTFVWRPGMGEGVEKGWVTTLDTLIIPELGGKIYLEGNPAQLNQRINLGLDDLSKTRFNHEKRIIDNIVETFTEHPQFTKKNEDFCVFIQLATDNNADVFIPVVYLDYAANGYKIEKFSRSNFVVARTLYMAPRSQDSSIANTTISQNIILGLMASYLGYGGEFAKLKPVVGGFVNEVEIIFNKILGKSYISVYLGYEVDIAHENSLVTIN